MFQGRHLQLLAIHAALVEGGYNSPCPSLLNCPFKERYRRIEKVGVPL